MSSFTEGLCLELLPNGSTFKLLKPFGYYLEANNEEVIKVPAGFTTDFASVPRIFTPLVEKMGKHSKASLLHDYLYFNPAGRTRKQCDTIFLEAMAVAGVSKVKRYAMYYAVRIGGKSHFKGS